MPVTSPLEMRPVGREAVILGGKKGFISNKWPLG